MCSFILTEEEKGPGLWVELAEQSPPEREIRSSIPISMPAVEANSLEMYFLHNVVTDQ